VKALILQRYQDMVDRTGKFEVATQWGHIGNDCWLFEGETYTREDLTHEYGRFSGRDYQVTEAELIVKGD